MQLQEAPRGYLINPEHVDTAELLHEMLSGVDYPRTPLHLKKPVQRLIPKGEKITRHIRHQNKASRDEAYRRQITRKMNFHGARESIKQTILGEYTKRKATKDRRWEITGRLAELLKHRQHTLLL